MVEFFENLFEDPWQAAKILSGYVVIIFLILVVILMIYGVTCVIRLGESDVSKYTTPAEKK